MAGGAAEVHEPAFGKQKYFVAVGKGVLIYLRLDVRALHGLGVVERVDLNLVIEVPMSRRWPDLSSAACARA